MRSKRTLVSRPHSSGWQFLLGGLIVVLAATVFLDGCGSRRSRRLKRRPIASTETNRPDSIFDTAGESAPAGDEALAAAGPPATDGSAAEPASEARAPAAVADERRSAPVRDPRTADEILNSLSQKSQTDALEAEYQQRLGDDAFDSGDFVAAERHFRKALDLNPGLIDARERLHTAMTMLGKRSGLVQPLLKELGDEGRAEKELILDDARRGIREAKTLIQAGDADSLGAAERNLAQIADQLTSYEFSQDVSSKRDEAKALLAQVKDLKTRRDANDRRKKEALVRDEKKRLRANQQVQEKRRVEELILKAADYIRFKEYNKAIQACQQILEINPNHQIAKYWLKESKTRSVDLHHARLMAEGREQMELNKEALLESGIPWVGTFTFPEEREWARIQRRKEKLAILQADDPEPIRKIKNLLDSTEVSFEFEEKPLSDVVAFIRTVTGINIEIDPTVLEEDEYDVDLTVQNMKARNALNLILLQTDLAHTYQENILYITKKEKARGSSEFAIYNVSDILNKIRDFAGPKLQLKAPGDTDEAGGDGGIAIDEGFVDDETVLDPDTLEELIKDSTGGEEFWGDEDLYNMEYHQGLLLVNAPRELHFDIQKVLENLREDSDLFVMIEARFIDVTDDFLEDIGVDFRALGVVNNLGTPFGNVINDSRTGGNDIGFVKTGSPVRDVTLIMGQDRWAGRMQNIIDGFTGLVNGERVRGGSGVSGLTVQATWLDPFQINAIIRAVQEKSDVRQLTAPTITAHNGQRVYVSVITQRAYIADYELVSGGTGFSIIEVADPIVATFQEGVILDVDPVISPDKKYITLDVRPTMATLIGGIISTILISLGSFTNVAFQVPIGVPEVSLQQTFTSVTVPNGGTVLLGGFKSIAEAKYVSYLPILAQIPIIKNIFRRKAVVSEKRSLAILITARIINPRLEEEQRFNTN